MQNFSELFAVYMMQLELPHKCKQNIIDEFYILNLSFQNDSLDSN
jgi:hypothetical protein